MIRVLVCGGRHYNGLPHVYRVLDRIHEAQVIHSLICGGCSGADGIAWRWARHRRIEDIGIYKAHWDLLGRSAGPQRNQEMIDIGRPDLGVAFPGGRGTADMVRRLLAAKIMFQDERNIR